MGIGQVTMERAVFLDRDGIINEVVLRDGKPYPPTILSEVKITEGFENALKKLKAAGYMIVGITNQPDVARGSLTQTTVEEINRYLLDKLPIDKILVCYHDDKDACACRKPKPGLILEAAALLNIDLEYSYMVGDRWKDIESGKNAGCKTIFVDYGYSERPPVDYNYCVQKPSDIVNIILSLK